MAKLQLIATATFGLEAVVKREIEGLGYKILKSEDAKITYLGDERAVVRSNPVSYTHLDVYKRQGHICPGPTICYEYIVFSKRAVPIHIFFFCLSS